MREILFRGRTVSESEYLDDGKWIKGSYTCFNGDEHRIYTGYAETDCGDYYPEWFNVIPETVGQFTGLYDKNGKRIFEGDIVTGLFLHSMPVNGVVAFRDGSFGLLWDRAGAETFTPFTSMCNVQYEVIGNIHDNPELLNEREDTK